MDDDARGCCTSRLDATTGAWYWRRGRLVAVVMICSLACVLGDVMLASVTPHTIKQAKRTLSGFDTLTSVTTDFLGLHTSFAREQESFLGYNSRVRCQGEHLRKSVRLLANDCSQSRASAVRAALDDLFASVEELSESALAEQLDCSDARPFWKAGAANSSTTRDGFFFINWSCRQACKVKEWAADGRRTVRDDWTDAYALELAERVQDAVDSLDVNERAVNAVLAYLRIGKAAVGDGLPGRDMVKFSAKTRVASLLLGKAARCMADLNAANLTAALPPPARGDCRLKAEFDGVRGWLVGYRKISETSESFTRFLNRLSRILENVSGALIITLLTCIGVLHILIFLFVHRAVYSHELDEGIRYSRRKLREGYALSKDVAFGSRDEFHEEASAPAPAPAPRPSRWPRANRLCDCFCDESFLIRFWVSYALCNAFLFGSLLVIVFLLLLLALGRDKTRCEYFYRKAPIMKSMHRQLKHDAEGSCFMRLAADAAAAPTWTNLDVAPNCYEDSSNGMKKSDFVVVLIAAGLVLVGNWVLIQWLPAVFGFAKPLPMRRRLHPAPVEEPASGVTADESGSARLSKNFRDEGFAGK